VIGAAQRLLERRPIHAMTETNQRMAHVDQLLQIYLKQLPLWLRRLALGLHQFFPSFMAVCCDYREILDQKTPKIIRFYHGFIGFSGSTNYAGSTVEGRRCDFRCRVKSQGELENGEQKPAKRAPQTNRHTK
jgi:hypothetical protein